MVQWRSLCAQLVSSVVLLCSLRPEAALGPRWFTAAGPFVPGSEPPPHSHIRLCDQKREHYEEVKDEAITVEGDHLPIRVFHEKATSGA